MIGIDTVRTLTLSIHVFSRFDRNSAIAAEVAALWEHSVAVGSLAQRITAAESGSKAMTEESFAAGLLHDLGKVILLSQRPVEYRAIRQRPREGISVEDAEIEVLGCSHAHLGGYLMSIWGLPTSLVQAVAFHHCPSQAVDPAFSTLTAVHCANVLVHQMKDGVGTMVMDESYLERLGLVDKAACWRSISMD